jgi:hypothetical protein
VAGVSVIGSFAVVVARRSCACRNPVSSLVIPAKAGIQRLSLYFP